MVPVFRFFKNTSDRPQWLSRLRGRLVIRRSRVRSPPGDLRRVRQHSFMEIDHEIFSKVFLSFPLNQKRQLSVSRERMCTILVNHLEDMTPLR